jgi:hypothetical protein
MTSLISYVTAIIMFTLQKLMTQTYWNAINICRGIQTSPAFGNPPPKKNSSSVHIICLTTLPVAQLVDDRIREVLGSSLSPDIIFLSVSSVPVGMCWDSTSIRPQPLPSKSSVINRCDIFWILAESLSDSWRERDGEKRWNKINEEKERKKVNKMREGTISQARPGLGLFPRQIMCDLWWTKRHWGSFPPNTLVSPANSHLTDCCHTPGLIK